MHVCIPVLCASYVHVCLHALVHVCMCVCVCILSEYIRVVYTRLCVACVCVCCLCACMLVYYCLCICILSVSKYNNQYTYSLLFLVENCMYNYRWIFWSLILIDFPTSNVLTHMSVSWDQGMYCTSQCTGELYVIVQ